MSVLELDFEPLGEVVLAEGLEHVAQVALHHAGEVVGRVVDPVVRDAVLRVVVGPDLLAAVAVAGEVAAVLPRFGLLGGAALVEP